MGWQGWGGGVIEGRLRTPLCPDGPLGGHLRAAALGLWERAAKGPGSLAHLTVFPSRHILEEPAVSAVGLEPSGGQEVPDALQRAGVPAPEAQAQAP